MLETSMEECNRLMIETINDRKTGVISDEGAQSSGTKDDYI